MHGARPPESLAVAFLLFAFRWLGHEVTAAGLQVEALSIDLYF
jgi:hypothetical protein